MTEIAQDVSQQQDGQSVVSQAQEKVEDTARQVSERARQAAAPVQDRLREELTTRSSQLGDQAGVLGQALRRTSEELHGQGQSAVAGLPEQAATVIERWAEYLRRSDADRILQDLEDLGRRQPWAVAAGGIAVGFVASRFLKASSSRRYLMTSDDGWRAAPPRLPQPGAVPPAPGASASPMPAVRAQSYVPPQTLPEGGVG